MEIEAEGLKWETNYVGYITIQLLYDNETRFEETQIKIELHTKQEPVGVRHARQTTRPTYPYAPPLTAVLEEGRKQLGGVKVFYWFVIAFLAFNLIACISTIIASPQLMEGSYTEGSVAQGIIVLIFVFGILMTLYIIPLVGIIKRRPWSVPFTRAILVITMFGFPIGTIIGAVLWGRINDSSTKEYLNYGTPPPTAVVPHRRLPTWAKWVIGLVILVMMIIILRAMISTREPSTQPGPLKEVVEEVVEEEVVIIEDQETLPRKIAFVSDRDGDFEIYVMDPSGENEKNLTQNSADDRDPAPSPGGKKIAFVSDRNGNQEIYTMNSDGSNVVQIQMIMEGIYPPIYMGPSTPTWISGEDVLFVYSPGPYNSWIMETSIYDLYQPPRIILPPVLQLPNPDPEVYEYPSISPDGSKIAFNKNTYDVPLVTGFLMDSRIAISNLSGFTEIFSTNFGGQLSPQAWSPSGDKIIFSSKERIGVIELEGGKFLWFTFPEVTWLNISGNSPSWSPDGKWIAYENQNEIYILEIESGTINQITENNFRDMNPVWMQ